ncbi:hypothetical protein B0H15DRAFT_166453 [Mycena belliarum]|uniref:Uncharacterized protein n=1 Tax=Mycena belliarum TaxID=1033014 RepID=A0AAD6U8I4_9AGAR|nr:hypothetical protein B0H15DRAFT_166453 [Mycena belliae]
MVRPVSSTDSSADDTGFHDFRAAEAAQFRKLTGATNQSRFKEAQMEGFRTDETDLQNFKATQAAGFRKLTGGTNQFKFKEAQMEGFRADECAILQGPLPLRWQNFARSLNPPESKTCSAGALYAPRHPKSSPRAPPLLTKAPCHAHDRRCNTPLPPPRRSCSNSSETTPTRRETPGVSCTPRSRSSTRPRGASSSPTASAAPSKPRASPRPVRRCRRPRRCSSARRPRRRS